jgi:hypothetical protein
MLIQDTIVVNNTAAAADTIAVAAPQRDTTTARPSHSRVATPDSTSASVMPAPADSTATAADSTAAQKGAADTGTELPDSLPLLYRGSEHTDSLLAADSLLFNDKPLTDGRFTGMKAQALPQALFRNDGVSIALLSCFLLILLFLAHSWQQLRQRLRLFFMPKQSSSSASHTDAKTFELVHFMLGCQLSLIIALLFYSYADANLSVNLINLPPLALLGIYAAVAMLTLIVKQRLYHFVHSTFFTKAERRRWYEAFSLLFIFESLVLFPLALLSVYFDLALEKVSIILIGVLFFVKILLFFKAFSVFFGKIKGCLHLFVYFCALELLPLLLAWGVLVELTRLFITIF